MSNFSLRFSSHTFHGETSAAMFNLDDFPSQTLPMVSHCQLSSSSVTQHGSHSYMSGVKLGSLSQLLPSLHVTSLPAQASIISHLLVQPPILTSPIAAPPRCSYPVTSLLLSILPNCTLLHSPALSAPPKLLLTSPHQLLHPPTLDSMPSFMTLPTHGRASESLTKLPPCPVTKLSC